LRTEQKRNPSSHQVNLELDIRENCFGKCFEARCGETEQGVGKRGPQYLGTIREVTPENMFCGVCLGSERSEEGPH
jgi:hypothetical protein